ncbi:hypothetical protein HispidOSU_015199 [Sigmodon hispidus]
MPLACLAPQWDINKYEAYPGPAPPPAGEPCHADSNLGSTAHQPCDSWQDALPPARDWERSLENGAEDSQEMLLYFIKLLPIHDCIYT